MLDFNLSFRQPLKHVLLLLAIVWTLMVSILWLDFVLRPTLAEDPGTFLYVLSGLWLLSYVTLVTRFLYLAWTQIHFETYREHWEYLPAFTLESPLGRGLIFGTGLLVLTFDFTIFMAYPFTDFGDRTSWRFIFSTFLFSLTLLAFVILVINLGIRWIIRLRWTRI